jgi:hypothetical protein
MRRQFKQILFVVLVATVAYIGGRTRSVSALPSVDETELRSEWLDKRVKLQVPPKSLAATIGDIGAAYGTTLVVDWPALEAAGLDRDQEAFLQSGERSLVDAVQAVSRPGNDAADQPLGLDVVVRGGAICVVNTFTTRKYVRVYDITAVLDAMRATGGQQPWPVSGSNPRNARDDARQHLLLLIDPMLDRSSFDLSPAHLWLIDDILVVSGTRADHRRIRDFLHQLETTAQQKQRLGSP